MRSGRSPLLLMGLVWLLVVAAVGSVTYLVVDRAGKEVADVPGPPTVVAGPSVQASATSPRPTRTSPRPTPSRTRTKSPTPTPTPEPAATSVAPAPTSTPPSTTPRPNRTPTPSPTPTRTTHTASFSTRGGTVVASCTGERIEVRAITPRDGWRVEKEVEGDRLEVHFKAAEDEVEVKIRCRDGVAVEGDD